ncbi:MAG: efflux RND transporter permease subunit [Opitutales bacterium]
MKADTSSLSTTGRLATLTLRNRHLLVLLLVVVLVAGWSALQSMPRLEDPVITTRNAQIFTLVPGSSAERIEALVNEKIEQALQEIPEIKTVTSTARSGISVVAVELDDRVTSANNKQIFARVRDEVEQAARQFPPEALAPVVDDKRGAIAFTLIAGITWEPAGKPNLGIMNRFAETLADRLRNIAGTELVRIYGAPEEEIRVALDRDAAAAAGLTAAQVAGILRRSDPKIPAGVLRDGEADLVLEVAGALDSIERVARTPLRTDPETGAELVVGDIAEVTKGWREPVRQIGLTDGRRSIFVAARIQEDQRVDVWSGRAEAVLETFRAELGDGPGVKTVFLQNTYTTQRLGELAFNLFLGAVVVVLVILATMGWRAAGVVGSALPLTAALTVALIGFSGGKLHQMSIFGMIIALGLLIDNAIVITDEVRARLFAGRNRLQACAGAVRHLFVPLLSSTLTTMLAFMPILLLPGNAGDFVGAIGGSVVFALGCSFFVAIAIIAALAALFIKAEDTGRAHDQGLSWRPGTRALQGLVGWAVRRPLGALGIAVIIPALGFFLGTRMEIEFFPRVDRDMFGIQVWLPDEASVERTYQLSRDMEAVIREAPTVRGVDWLVGASFPSVYYNLVMNKDNASFYTQAIVTTESPEATRDLIPQLQDRLSDRFPQAQVVATQFAQGPPAEASVEFRVIGPDIRELQRLGQEVRALLARDPLIAVTRTTLPSGIPKLWFEAEESAVRAVGLGLVDIAGQLQTGLEGLTGGSVLEETEELPVRVRLAEINRRDLTHIRGLPVLSREAGGFLPLEALGEWALRPDPGAITRRNGERVNTIQGFTRNEALPIEVTRAIQEDLTAWAADLPPGYRLEVGGASENQADAVGNLMLYLPVIVTLTIAILILAFRSVRVCLILLAAAGLSVGFGLLATWLYGLPFSFNTLLGSFGLIGLAFNASIVVIASIRAHDAVAAGHAEGIRSAALSCTRHLVSTTFTTIGSFLPLLIFVGGDFWPPLAIVLAGGVGGSTFLALVFTPAAYRLLHRKSFTTQTA